MQYSKEKCVKKPREVKPIKQSSKLPRHEARTRPINPSPIKLKLDSELYAGQ